MSRRHVQPPNRARRHARARGTPLLLAWLCAAPLACSARAGNDGAAADSATRGEASDGAPVLASVVPDTIRLGKGENPTLVVSGSGFIPGTTGTFATGENVVRVGPAAFDMLPADSAGRTIRFVLTLRYVDTTVRNRPASFGPGTYPVSVTTPRGTSNARPLTMIP